MDHKPIFNLGLIGWPVEHSLSMAIHDAALNASKLSGEFRLYPVPPTIAGKNRLGTLLDRMRAGEIQGLNVTVPHKQNVIPFLDSLSAEAGEIGAVNTIALKRGRLVGENTDARGFLDDLKQQIPGKTSGSSALILGAGGAARAAAFALTREGWEVTVAARRYTQAEALVADLSVGGRYHVSAVPLTKDAFGGRLFRLLVNATPVGMAPHALESPWPVNLPFPEGCFVYDMVYNPRDTVFVKQARLAGLTARSGLGMLAAQAALSFEIWTGLPAPRPQMMKAADDALKLAPSLQEANHAA
jgi:shikimate dehydrogenase